MDEEEIQEEPVAADTPEETPEETPVAEEAPPETPADAPVPDEAPTDLVENPEEGTVPEVLEAVGDDPEAAATALAAEEGTDEPRITLTGPLTTIAEAEEDEEDEEDEDTEQAQVDSDFRPTMTNRVQATMVDAANLGSQQRRESIRRNRERREAQGKALQPETGFEKHEAEEDADEGE